MRWPVRTRSHRLCSKSSRLYRCSSCNIQNTKTDGAYTSRFAFTRMRLYRAFTCWMGDCSSSTSVIVSSSSFEIFSGDLGGSPVERLVVHTFYHLRTSNVISWRRCSAKLFCNPRWVSAIARGAGIRRKGKGGVSVAQTKGDGSQRR